MEPVPCAPQIQEAQSLMQHMVLGTGWGRKGRLSFPGQEDEARARHPPTGNLLLRIIFQGLMEGVRSSELANGIKKIASTALIKDTTSVPSSPNCFFFFPST